jgi:hypothetical protein
MSILKMITGFVLGLAALVGLAWLGTRVPIESFDSPAIQPRELVKVKPPTDLPAPVARYVKAAFGDEIPVIQSAIVQGKADLVFNGIPFPGRFKFYHDAGKAYYHYMQLGWFGQPIVTVNERYQDGIGIMDIPGSWVEDDPNTNAGANLGLWAESIWLPSVWFTDTRVRWEAVDDTTARLIVPAAAPEEAMTLRFDPQTGLIKELVAMRYQNPDSLTRTRWTDRILSWQNFNGILLPATADIQWGSDAPWVTWHVEQVFYNVDVSGRLAQFGSEEPLGEMAEIQTAS